MSAPYELNWSPTDDGTFEFSLAWDMTDGTAFPWADYEIEYALSEVDGGELFRLRQDDGGILVDTTAGTVTFAKPGYALSPGIYAHGCRARHRATEKPVPIFDGTVTVSEGGFSSLS